MNIAIIGYGNMGKRHHRILQELGVTDFVIVDPSNPVGISIETLLMMKKKPEAVFICTPATTHVGIARKTLAAKIPTFVEKPLATTEKDAKELLLLAQKNKTLLFAGHVERYNPVVRKAKEFVNSGSLGDIVFLSSRRFGYYPTQCKDVDVSLDLAVHDVDILNFILDKLPNRIATNRRRSWLSDRDDFIQIDMQYEKISTNVQCSWVSPVKIRDLTIIGTHGYLTGNYITQELNVYQSNVAVGSDTTHPKFVDPDVVSLKLSGREPLKEEDNHFLGMLSDKKIVPPTHALEAIRICLN